MLLTLLALLASGFALWRIGRRTRYFLHVFQLEGYKPGEFGAWLRARADTHVLRRSHALGFALVGAGWAGALLGAPYWTVVVATLLWGAAFASSRLYRSDRPKKPLAWTARMKRLAGAAGALVSLPVLAGLAAGWDDGPAGVLAFLTGLLAADFFAPVLVLLAGVLAKPVEAGVQEGFKADARARLAARPDLVVVGITGSYGKTSVKFIVAELLGQRFNVLATPSSYNTPMGVCLVINNKLRPDHQVLILEMGMRYPGDIEELCEIARPAIAVVTSVGVAHLESMGTVEAIAAEKASLLKFMKPGGTAILNGDDARVDEMHGAEAKTIRVSLGDETKEITGRDVRYGPEGMTLTVRDDTGEEAVFRTRLLGAHNAQNLLLGVAVGRALGLRLRAMAQAAGRIEPVAHRLALRREHGVTVIDDAFNSNPVGARNAVEILGQFADRGAAGRRVIVTPGMVELGARQHEENRAFGEHIARNADVVVLVGERQTAPIREGLDAAGYPPENIHVAPNLFAAQDFLQTRLRPGDVVLYENDLPDQYDGG